MVSRVQKLLLGLALLCVGCWAESKTIKIELFAHLNLQTVLIGASRADVCQGRLCIDGTPQVSFASSAAIRLPDGSRRDFVGPKEIRVEANRLRVFATLPLEDAVAAVVEREAFGMRELEAVKVVAMAARSFYSGPKRHQHGFCDSTHCQTLRKIPSADSIAGRAAKQTEGKLVTYRGGVFPVLYSTRCGGRTLTAKEVGFPTKPYPYFSVECPVCQRHPDRWEFRLPNSLRGWLDGLLLGPGGSRERLRITVGRKYGWAKVRSNRYEVSESGSDVVIRGEGLGHSVGICMFGIQGLAGEGWTAERILRLYLPEID